MYWTTVRAPLFLIFSLNLATSELPERLTVPADRVIEISIRGRPETVW